MPFPDPVAANASGRLRMLAIASENKAEIEKLVAHMIGGLKRPATAGEIIEAELVAVSVVKSRRLRENGRDDSKERDLLQRLMKETVFGSVPAPSPAEIQHGKAVADAIDQHNRQAGIAALHGYVDPAPDEAIATDEVSNAG
jgi:hypothetical protein